MKRLIRKAQNNSTITSPVEEKTLSLDDLNKMLLAACKSGNLNQANDCIKKGANVNYKDSAGLNLLHWSIRNNNLVILNVLLNHKANVNQATFQKWTPLMEACKKKSLQAIRLLHQKNCNVNLKDVYGNTALIVCVQNNFADGVRELLSYQANRNIVNNQNKKAIDIAQQLKRDNLVKLLTI